MTVLDFFAAVGLLGSIGVALAGAMYIINLVQKVDDNSNNIKKNDDCLHELYSRSRKLDEEVTKNERRIISLDIRISKLEGAKPGEYIK